MRVYNLRSALQKPEFITGLFLNHMELKEIPSEVFRLPNLKELDLRFNKIAVVPATISKLIRLERLVLSNNQIEYLPFELGQLPVLREIRLENNQLGVWPEVLHNLSHLEKATLSHNRLGIIPGGIQPFKKLRELSLSFNQLKKLPGDIGQWRALRFLDLCHNRLGRLPVSIGNCLELDYLNLSHNQLRQLPQTLSNIEKLRFLDIASNSFTEIPQVIFSIRYLRHLIASGNRISLLPDSIAHLQWLSHLNLNGNGLEHLPVQLDKCAQLQVLLLEGNGLKALPVLSALSRLRQLNSNKNQLRTLPPLPFGLKILTLSKNLLPDCPAVISELRNLETLDLSYNAIKVLSKNFHQLQQLVQFDFQKNEFTEWPAVLLQLDRLKKLKSDWPVAHHKTFFRLLQACLKAGTPVRERLQLFQLLTEGSHLAKALSRRTLFQAINLKHSELRRLGRAELYRRQGEKTIDLKREGQLCILGKTALTRKVLIKRLHQQKISTSILPANDTKYILLGAFPGWCPELTSFSGVFLTEFQVINWLDEQEGRYLSVATGERELARLRELLLHENPVNVQLAVQLMEGGGVPSALLTALLIAWKKTKVGKLRRALRQLLEQYTPEESRWVLEQPFSLSPNQPKALLRANITRICTGTPFEEDKIMEYGRL